MTKKFETFFLRIIKYSLNVIILSTLVLAVGMTANLTAVNQAKAAGWWEKAYEGGLKDVGPAYGQTGTPSDNYDIRLFAARLIRVVLELLGLIFLILIIVAGFRWMMAGGDEEKVTTAKKQLTNGVIGLAIILVAFIIATYVFYYLQYAITGIMPITWSPIF